MAKTSTKTQAQNVTPPQANGTPASVKPHEKRELRKPHIVVLTALSKSRASMRRKDICASAEADGIKLDHGRIWAEALTFRLLEEKNYILKTDRPSDPDDKDSAKETVYKITKEGRAALKKAIS